jgi:hypothetical protein
VSVDLALEQIRKGDGAALAKADYSVEWAGRFYHFVDEIAGVLDIGWREAVVVA